MSVDRRDFISALVVSVIANTITAGVMYLFGRWLNLYLSLNISSGYIVGIVFVASALFSIVIISQSYQTVLKRLAYIRFLKEDSATRSFELFADIGKRLIEEAATEPSDSHVEKYIMPQLKHLVEKRRQPMQIIEIDCQKIIERTKEHRSQLSVEEQILYYLDFMKAFKKMALPRVVRQASLYMESFGADGFTEYVVTYGHSTIVVEAIIFGYKRNPFPVVVIEDLQYHERSLGEHKIVCQELKKAGVPYFLIKFQQIRELFDTTMTSLSDVSGNSLPLLRKRRLHLFIGCERIGVHGNILVPAEIKGVPSETAQIVQEMEAFSQKRAHEGYTTARVVVLAESYKIRDYDRIRDVQTHVPLKGRYFQSLLYVFGVRKRMPDLFPVSLYNIDSSNIYVHINELGIFPKVGGKFDLQYCIDIFESETNLLGFFARPRFLLYHVFDEIEAVLFDFNGVIVDDEEIHYVAFRDILEDLNIKFSFEDYEKFCRGRSDADGFTNIVNHYNLDTSNQLLVDKKHKAYLEIIKSSGAQTFPGVKRVLKELKNRGYKVALVTASNREEMNGVLPYLNINDYFDVIITADDVSESKPFPESYSLAATKLGIAPVHCFVIEDSPVNIDNVSRLGMKTMGVRNGSNKSFSTADYVFDSLEDILVM